MAKVLIIGERPELMDYSDPAVPPGTTAEKIRAGLDKSVEDLRAKGHAPTLCLTEAETDLATRQVSEALGRTRYDVIVVGAGLRVVPKHAQLFERVMNAVHSDAPDAAIAFNSSPDDSVQAVERFV